eukprot:TRINITY_DN8796_c0_g1_i1.p1 TRINITY_DN8796_c0_g1~~TRINITY_DN8796_c0_g1_i1.p1  ORF type:complete len:182 (-),score=66.49 TRINITY_DN8796_c0_g1_i1:58-603(-)
MQRSFVLFNRLSARTASTSSSSSSLFSSSSSSLLSRSFSSPSTTTSSEMNPDTREVLEGVPPKLHARKVSIFLPTRIATQQGPEQAKLWRLQYQTEPRWDNPLMGWTSTRDPLSRMRLSFESSEEAVQYAKNHGLDYTVEPERHLDDEEKLARLNALPVYEDNFTYNPDEKDPTGKDVSPF